MSLLAQGVTKNSSEYYFVALSVSLLAAQMYIRFIEEVLETYQLSTYMREIFYDKRMKHQLPGFNPIDCEVIGFITITMINFSEPNND